MNSSASKRAQRVFLLWACIFSGAALSIDATGQSSATPAGANTTIGSNVLLADGAAALMSGDWQRGVELTELGLSSVLSREDQAAALANLCAGYAALKEFAKGLEFCNRSLAILTTNWRTWQNRAACNLGLGNIEESLQDIQQGLKINPNADSLQKTLAIAREYEKLQQERMQNLLES